MVVGGGGGGEGNIVDNCSTQALTSLESAWPLGIGVEFGTPSHEFDLDPCPWARDVTVFYLRFQHKSHPKK